MRGAVARMTSSNGNGDGRRTDEKEYFVSITSNEQDVLRRVDLLTSTMFRLLRETRLVRVVRSDYKEGCVELLVKGRKGNAMVSVGKVTIKIECTTEDQQSEVTS